MEKKTSWRMLRANLTERTIDHEEIDGETLLLYMGGSGIGSKILYEETAEATDPLGPENRLIFMTGLFTGSSVPASGRHSIISKSPLTNIYGESDIGGSWGVTLKGAGYDGVVITGKSEDPIYLLITAHGVEIKDARQLWGKDSYETDYLVKKDIGPKSAVMCIGQSGEKLSRISSIMSNGRHGRAAGRCGFGAVMGSKKLKAIAVLGERQIRGEFQNDRSLKDSVSDLLQTIKEKGKPLSEYGTAGQILNAEETGDLPIKNWIAGSWRQGAQKISGQRMSEQILSGRYSCRGCIIGCGRVVNLFDDRFGKVSGGGPEYETLAAFGSMCLVDDLPVIAKANEICNRYGIDTVSTGNIIAFAMEAYENKLILKEDLDNVELEWGNSNALLELVAKIGKREGIGELLSEGIRISAEKIGQGSKNFAMHVKGLELPMHDPRAFSSLAIAYATSRIGASHWAATHSLESKRPMPDLGYHKILDRFESKGKGVMTARMQDYMEMFESLKICKFISWVPLSSILDWIYYVTGTRMEPKEFMMTGERISNLKRMYNVRHGITRKDDNLPERIMTQKRGEGGASDHLPNLEMMLDEYYLCRDWDEDGIPKMDKLRKLDLEKLVRIKTL